MKKRKVFYLHTIDGLPASYIAGHQICYINHRGKAYAKLATSLRQIRKEQALSIKYRREQLGLYEDGDKYGYKRVCI